jgi:putative nucleotidyltransferase with HDIG domain
MVATVLTAVFVGVAINIRERVRAAVTDKLEASQRTLSELEQRRARELSVQVATLAESPSLKSAVASYLIEMRSKDSRFRNAVLTAIDRELNSLASRTSLDILAATDVSGTVLAAAGRRNADWPRQSRVLAEHGGSGSAYVSMRAGVFQFASAPLTLQSTTIGTLQLGKALDERYARELSTLSGAGTLIASGDTVVATTLPPDVADDFTPQALASLSSNTIVTVEGLEYATRLLFQDGNTRVYALDSIAESTRAPMRSAFRAMLIFAICSFAIAAVASFWLARTISRPIDTLSKSLSQMTSSRDFDNPLPPTGISLEVDALTATFNAMMQSVCTAEEERRGTYVGAIKALAMALDARDPYTAGHSERVSALSELIGRQMNLPEEQLEVLRLGALLHDIGKIGISDAVLRKPGPLTPEEYAAIREHPSMGARILKSVPFLAQHIPIVELHHERPDGEGYPHRLRGSETPVLARIVHVADAFDAITSARAYRRARGSAQALRELWRYAGTQFDTEVVQAFAEAMPAIEGTTFGDIEMATAIQKAQTRLTLVGPTAPRKVAGGRPLPHES